MVAAWEMPRHNILVSVLHTDNTSIAWALGLRKLQIPGQVIGLAGMPYDHSRNAACHTAIQNGFTHIGFLDSDVIPQPDAFLRLLAHNKPFISGMYCRRSPPESVPVMLRNGQWITDLPGPGQDPVIEVDLVGAGLLLISCDFLKQIPPQRPGKPWFDWRVDMRGVLPEDQCLSEDFTLCRHIRQLGYKVLVDTSITARHVGLAQSTYGLFKPCEAAA
jgi:hypothetical protein